MLLLAAIALVAYIPYKKGGLEDARLDSDCARYYKAACANWPLGTWLPTLIDGYEPVREDRAMYVRFSDAFVGAPTGGTNFVYGSAGPPSGTVVYDGADATVFYEQGCCDWRSTVLATRVTPPPIPVVDHPLARVHTKRGIALGDTLAQVRAIDGNVAPQQLPGFTDVTILSYVHMYDASCGQFQNFGFLHDRLVYIELLSGC